MTWKETEFMLYKTRYFYNHPEIIKSCYAERAKVLENSLYNQIWPSSDPRREIYKNVSLQVP